MQNNRVQKSRSIPFHYILDTFIAVPMTVDGSIKGNFILDTGIGVNLLSKTVCEKLSCHPTHNHVGKRMSGQEIKIPMSTVNSLAIGDTIKSKVAVGIYDIESLIPNQNIMGFVGLDFFDSKPFTIDYKYKIIVIESQESLKEILAKGFVVPIQLDRIEDSLTIMMKINLPSKEEINVEVDTGSQGLILDEKYMESLEIIKNNTRIEKKEGIDETGYSYSRYFTKLSGTISISGSPEIKETEPHVMFQKIIYDGLVGHNFLSQYIVTYDLTNARLIFQKFI